MAKLRLRISDGNSKLGRIPNVSFPPIISCREDAPCTEKCYALKSYKMYQNVRTAWGENYKLWEKDMNQFFSELDAYLRWKQPRLFRFFVAGDIPNQDFVDEMAVLPSSTKYLTFTKRYDLEYGVLGDNHQIILSTWPEFELPKNKDLPWAWLSTDSRIPEDMSYLRCIGKCDECQGKCWEIVNKDYHVVFNPH